MLYHLYVCCLNALRHLEVWCRNDLKATGMNLKIKEEVKKIEKKYGLKSLFLLL